MYEVIFHFVRLIQNNNKYKPIGHIVYIKMNVIDK